MGLDGNGSEWEGCGGCGDIYGRKSETKGFGGLSEAKWRVVVF